jgi:putative transposase
MSDNKRNISKTLIEKEIYKTFELFKKQKNIKIIEFINNFDTTILRTKKYRKIKFSYESLIKLILYQKLKGIKKQTKLIKYLKRNRSELKQLGLNQIPNQRTISYFNNRILDEQTKNYIDFIADKIEYISEKFGIILDIKTLHPEKTRQKQSKSSIEHKKNDKAREISRYIKKRFSPVINLNLHHNTKYSKKDFIDLILHMCLKHDFANNGSKTLKENRENVPYGGTLLYHLKNYNDIYQIKRNFITIFEMIWETARKNNIINNRKPVTLAIDYTEFKYYGKKDTPMIRDTIPEKGLRYCYKYITMDIVDSGKRFTLIALPMGPFDRQENLLRELLIYAKQRVKIKRVLADRGFFDSKSIQLFKDFNVKFITPCSSNNRIKKILEAMPAPSVINDYPMKNTTFNVIVVEDQNKIKRAFATNIFFNENDVDLAEYLFTAYGRRWGIETGYRVKKDTFTSRTTSKNYFIRLFYFLFSVLLYNLWILIDVLIWLSIFGMIKDKHLLSAKHFLEIIFNANQIDGG